MIIKVQEHSNSVTFLEQVVFPSEGVEECTARAQLLCRTTSQTPGAWANGTCLDTHHTVRPATWHIQQIVNDHTVEADRFRLHFPPDSKHA